MGKLSARHSLRNAIRFLWSGSFLSITYLRINQGFITLKYKLNQKYDDGS